LYFGSLEFTSFSRVIIEMLRL